MTAPRAGAPDRIDAWARRHPRATDVVLAVVLAGLVAPASVGLLRDGGATRGWTAAIGAALVVLHVAVAVRRWAPVAVFAATAAAELVLALAPPLGQGTAAPYSSVLLPSSLAYLVVAYTVSAWADRPWPRLSLLVGTAGALVATARVATLGPPGTPGELLFLVGALLAAVVAAWALGRSRRLRADQLAGLAERARTAEADREERDRRAAADERARIARELHDVVAHSVSVMVRQAEAGRYVAARDPAAAAATLATIADTGREALTDMRALLGVLRTDATPAGTDPQPTVDELPELVDRVRAAGQPVTLRVDGDPRPLDRAAHLAAFRLVQEALTNVVKHAGPRARAEVVLSWTARALQVRVTDSGSAPGSAPGSASGAERGAAPAARPGPSPGPAEGGRGLLGMTERVQLVGGSLRTGPAPGGGFSVEARIPVAGTAADRVRPPGARRADA
jgi:signal transduction histidine kinase